MTSETLQALAPLTSALSAAGLSHNPATTWPPPPAWPVTGRFPATPVRAAALSAVCRAPAPHHAMPPSAVRPPFDVGWSPCALSGEVGAMAGGGQGGIPPPAVRPMIPATAVGQQATQPAAQLLPPAAGPLPNPPCFLGGSSLGGIPGAPINVAASDSSSQAAGVAGRSARPDTPDPSAEARSGAAHSAIPAPRSRRGRRCYRSLWSGQRGRPPLPPAGRH